MKNCASGLLIATTLGLASGIMGCRGAGSADGVRTAVFRVDGMACQNCAKHIEEELREVPGVKSATVDFASRTARVTLDEGNPATQKAMDEAVTKWKMEHFSQESDPDCLDPKKREEIKKGM